MDEQRLIDANAIGVGMAIEWQKALVKAEADSVPTINPEDLPIVSQLREELRKANENYQAGIAIALSQRDEAITRAEKAERERDAAICDMEALMRYSGEGCNICANSVEVHRKPYVRLECKIGGNCGCTPKWRGIDKEE